MIDLSILDRLAKELSINDIIWGVGGSYLLQIYNLYSEPNDLDLWVQPCDIPKIRNIFKGFEEVNTDIPLPEEFHFKMKYYDVEVDFVACFIIKPNQKKFTYNILPENINMMTLENGIKIPCTFLEDWYIVYKLLRREKKAALIENVFREKQIPFSYKVLAASLDNKNNKIQKKIIKDVNELIIFELQPLLFDYDTDLKDK